MIEKKKIPSTTTTDKELENPILKIISNNDNAINLQKEATTNLQSIRLIK